MRTIDRISEFVKEQKGNLILGAFSLAAFAGAVIKMPGETVTKVDLENGRSIIYMEPAFVGANTLLDYAPRNFLEGTYMKNPANLAYIDEVNKKAYEITSEGYVSLGNINREDDDGEFTEFSDDSLSQSLVWRQKKYEELENIALSEKARRKRLKEAGK